MTSILAQTEYAFHSGKTLKLHEKQKHPLRREADVGSFEMIKRGAGERLLLAVPREVLSSALHVHKADEWRQSLSE